MSTAKPGEARRAHGAPSTTGRRYTVENRDGARHALRFVEWRDGRAYLVTDGAASYLADPATGAVEGVESQVGITLRLVRGALRRLRHDAHAAATGDRRDDSAARAAGGE